ncbi:MAG: PAS domain S-box protein, partial [Isosphaeraceae bacterium]
MNTPAHPYLRERFRTLSRAAGVAVVLIGLTVLLGWGFDVETFRSVIPGMTAMNPGGTALAFILSGISLWIQSGSVGPRVRAFGAACAGAVALLALIRIGGYVFTWDGGPDQFLFRDLLDLEGLRTGHPNRMAPNTAAAMLLVGLGLLSLNTRSRLGVLVAQVLAMVTGVIALLAVVGYAYSASALAGIERFIPMALNTAVAVALMSVGILCARPDRGVMVVVTSQGAGGVMARRLLPAVIAIPAAVGWVRWNAQQAGYLDQVMGLSLYVLSNIVIFTVLIWWNAASLNRMDRKRRRAERRLGVQYTATRVLAESPRLEDALPQVLRAICDSLGWPVGAVWRMDLRIGALRCEVQWHSPLARLDEFVALTRRITFMPGEGLPGRVWASGQPAWIPDVTRDDNFPRASVADREGLHGAFGFPIVVGHDVLGVMEVFSGEIQHPDEDLLQMLTAVGSQIGQFMMRKRAEEEVFQERFLLHTLLDNVPDSIYFKDTEGRFTRINKSLAHRFGLSDSTLAEGKTDFDFFTDEHARPALADERAVMETGQALVGKEERETWEDGRVTWVSTTKLPFRERDGRLIGTFGISRDITDLKTTERALREGEERFRSLVEATSAIVWTTPASGEFETEQPGWSAFTGQTFDELRGWGWLDAVHPDDRANTARVWSQAVAARSLYQVEHRLRRHDGEYRHMLVRAVPILADGGEIREWVGVHTDVDDRKRAEVAIREAEERARLLLESSGEGIYGIDLQGRFTFINQAAARMLGLEPKEVLGENGHATIHHSHPDGSPYPVQDCPIYRAFRHGEGCRVDHEVFWRRDGSPFPVEYSSYPLRGGDGEIRGAVVNFSDVTVRKQVERELVEANVAAQAATRSKSEFLANMSHEIRTPLNGIIGMTELALDTELTPEQAEYLGMVKSSAAHLLNVINDILDFSKIEAGKLDLEYVAFNLRDTLDDTLATLATRAHKKGLELADHIATDVPDAVVGDPHRIRQVVVNLVGNAIKFTERGEVVLRVEALRRDADEVELHFALRDTGIGIAPETRQKLFKAFSQADTSTTRKYGGTGLGLAISARLVQMMGGEIWLESELGQGSTFHFTARFGLARGAAARPRLVEPVQVHGLPVLVVDDNATNRRILQEMLTNWGMKPFVVEGGREALKALEQARSAGTPFSLVLLDAMMPEMDGFTLAERIGRSSELVGSTLMMLSSANRREDAARCQELGVSAYLTKPIKQSTLLDAIMTTLGLTASVEEHDLSTEADQASPAAERRRLNLLLAEDNPVNQRLAVSLLKKRGHQVTVVGNGREALAAL